MTEKAFASNKPRHPQGYPQKLWIARVLKEFERVIVTPVTVPNVNRGETVFASAPYRVCHIETQMLVDAFIVGDVGALQLLSLLYARLRLASTVSYRALKHFVVDALLRLCSNPIAAVQRE